MSDRDEFEQILQELRARRAAPRTAMGRGTVVLDENVQQLAPALQSFNLVVKTVKPGTSDDDIKDSLSSRILITRNSKDFMDDASGFQYGIISLDHIKFIDPSPDPRENKLARMISRALAKFELWSKRHAFLLVLHEDGKHEYFDLVD